MTKILRVFEFLKSILIFIKTAFRVILNPLLYIKNLLAEISCRLRTIPQSTKIIAPYFSQYESINLTTEILKKKLDPKLDPNWWNSGAESTDEYESWIPNLAIIACLKMILGVKYETNYQSIPLAKIAMNQNVYKKNNTVDYYNFVNFTKDNFNIDGHVCAFLTTRRIYTEIAKNHYVILKVDENIRELFVHNQDSSKSTYILATGYNLRRKTIFIHNPSGFFNESQKYFEISEVDFLNYYKNSGVIMYNDWLFKIMNGIRNCKNPIG